jgi:hypothetical protein
MNDLFHRRFVVGENNSGGLKLPNVGTKRTLGNQP